MPAGNEFDWDAYRLRTARIDAIPSKGSMLRAATQNQRGVRIRRVSPVAAHPGEGRLTPATAAAQAWQPELVFLPLTGPLITCGSSISAKVAAVMDVRDPLLGSEPKND
jgi:hypothetical protein